MWALEGIYGHCIVSYMAMDIPSIITTSVGTCQIEVRQLARKNGFRAPVRKPTLYTDDILVD